jgi:hypothetical protein
MQRARAIANVWVFHTLILVIAPTLNAPWIKLNDLYTIYALLLAAIESTGIFDVILTAELSTPRAWLTIWDPTSNHISLFTIHLRAPNSPLLLLAMLH